MANQIDQEIKIAEARGLERLERDPRAESARYDALSGRVIVELVNGCTYAFPSKLVQDLNGATDKDLTEVTVDSVGFNLHWPTLDVDLDVPHLLAGVFGTRAWMSSEYARLAGRATSPAKAAAARSNGAKGGRPRKIATSS